MPIVIDGYNLMHAAGLMHRRFGPRGLERARRALVGVLAGSLGDAARRTTVVFDARGRGAESAVTACEEPSGIRVVFAPGPDGADAHIEELIRGESAPKRLRVVSSDTRIRQAAQRRNCETIDSDSFWQELVRRRVPRSAAEPRKSPDKPDVPADGAFWLGEFTGRVADKDLRELAALAGFDWDAEQPSPKRPRRDRGKRPSKP